MRSHETLRRCIKYAPTSHVIYSVGGRYEARSQCWFDDFCDLTRASGNSATIAGNIRATSFAPGPVSMNLHRVTAQSN